MSFPLLVTLSDLDSNVEAVESQLDRLYAALPVNEERLVQSFQTANRQATILSQQIEAERAGARWNDRASLEHLIQELKAAAEEKVNQKRRARLLDLANELDAGRVKHRLEARTALLNNLRSQAVDELRTKAALPEQAKELPGPAAHEWLFWAFDLQDGNDDTLLAELRSDLPALERFTAEMEATYWIAPPPREGSPPRGPQPPDKPNVGSSGSASVAVGTSGQSLTARAHSVSEMQAAEPEAVFTRSYEHRTDELAGKPEKASVVASPSSENEIRLRSESPSSESVVDSSIVASTEQSSDPDLQEPAVPLPTIFAAAAGDQTSDEEEKAGSIFGRVFSRKRSGVAWAIAGGFVVLSAVFFSVIYFMHDRSGNKPGPTVEAATTTATSPANTTAAAGMTTASSPTPNGTPASAPSTDPVSKATLLHKQPAEGAQESILLSLENCDRGATNVIECWGYASNLGTTTSRVSLDRVDVVDGRGNTFSLDRRGLFAFPSGQSSFIPAGSRVKFAVNVPDKDLEARTLTLYMDLSNPHSLEYTFRNVPVAE